MARTYAKLMTSIWSDEDFVALSGSAQRLYMALLSQPELSPCGVLTVHEGRLAGLASDTKPKDVSRDLAVLSEAGLVILDDTTGEAWIRSFLHHDGVLSSPNIFKSAARSWSAIHSKPIREAIREALPEPFRKPFPEGFLELSPKAIGEAFRKGFLEPLTEPSREPLPEGSLDHFLDPSPSPPTATLRPPGSGRSRTAGGNPSPLRSVVTGAATL